MGILSGELRETAPIGRAEPERGSFATSCGTPGPGNPVPIDIFENVIASKTYTGLSEGDSNPVEVSRGAEQLRSLLIAKSHPLSSSLSSSSSTTRASSPLIRLARRSSLTIWTAPFTPCELGCASVVLRRVRSLAC